MCVFSRQNVEDPQIVNPTQMASAKLPDQGAAAGAGKSMRDRMRAGAGTILTSGSGVTASAPTAKKTLLGQ